MVFPWLRPPLAQPSPYPAVTPLAPTRQSDEYADKTEELVAFQEKLSEGGENSAPKKPAICGASDI
jgi:hypothetical protein